MSPEERDELMNFILQSQSAAAEEHRAAMTRLEKLDLEMKEHTSQMKEYSAQLDKHTEQIHTLASVCHDFLEVSRIHARRLDRLDGLHP